MGDHLTRPIHSYPQCRLHGQRSDLAGGGGAAGVVPAAATPGRFGGQTVRVDIDCMGQMGNPFKLKPTSQRNQNSVLELGAGMAGLAGLGLAW